MGTTVQSRREIRTGDFCWSQRLARYLQVGELRAPNHVRCEDRDGHIFVVSINNLEQVISRSGLEVAKWDFIIKAERELEAVRSAGSRFSRDEILIRLRDPWPLDRPYSAGLYPELVALMQEFMADYSEIQSKFFWYNVFGRS